MNSLKNILLGALCLFIAVACSENQAVIENTVESSSSMEAAGFFGDTISMEGAITFDDILGQLESQDSVASKVVGTVAEVCQAKGCWMTLTQENKPSMMVRFKDYGFFVPKDISGRQVVMEGYAYRELTPVDELRHYAEDAGKSAEEIAAITEPKEEFKFLASGVVLLK